MPDIKNVVEISCLPALENVLYIEMLLKTESSPEKHSETVNYPTSVENANGQDNDSASVFLTPGLMSLK